MKNNVTNNLKDSITKELAGQPQLRREILSKFPTNEEKHLDFLKDAKNIGEIRKLISNKKLTNRQIKNKIREHLKEPEKLIEFLENLLDSTTSKKEETKEAMSSGGSVGAFSTKLGSDPNEYVNKVPTVREGVLKGGKADTMTLLDIARKHAYDDSTDSTTKEKIEKVHRELKSQLNKGIKTEMEHTKDKDRAKEIAMDHLSENPKYYDKLEKVETKEATSSSSSGPYSQTAIWAKSMKKKDFAGYRKPLYKGGKFVQVKKKCKKFPYCNQGDIKALKIFENENVQNAIDSVSSRYEIDKTFISELVYQKIRKSIN